MCETPAVPRLVLGPLLRHVKDTTATFWVETDSACTVEVRLPDIGRSESTRTFCVGGHHYGLVMVEDLEPATVSTYTVHVDDEQCWPDATSTLPPSYLRTLGGPEPLRVLVGSLPRGGAARAAVVARTSDRHRRARRRRAAVARDTHDRPTGHRVAAPVRVDRRPGVRGRLVARRRASASSSDANSDLPPTRSSRTSRSTPGCTRRRGRRRSSDGCSPTSRA